ncbi:hypothetical protein HJG60_011562 [Phyllostomus discolor]|uniref:Uncharacterized protein n=1 Tax=Phyllostomus discolor TaxID=89673 RepID=A0A834E190_9CHIR|nr:hypothetical protein HJG60_011562 [Phyllostomus discolor]
MRQGCSVSAVSDEGGLGCFGVWKSVVLRGCSRTLFFCVFCSMYLFLERREGREKQRERNISMREISITSCTPPTGDLARNPGMCPDWKLNRQPFASQAGTQSTEPHQPGQDIGVLFCFVLFWSLSLQI